MQHPNEPLFQPRTLGGLHLPNRIVMASMTRARAENPELVPTALVAEYYTQRASAGLILAEASWVTATALRHFRGTVMDNGGLTHGSANEVIQEGLADLVAFAVSYIANPDLVECFAQNLPLAAPDEATFYVRGQKGYADYPRASRAWPQFCPSGHNGNMTCFRIGSKFRCIRSTPTEMQSMSENDFECFASTGVNTHGTISPN